MKKACFDKGKRPVVFSFWGVEPLIAHLSLWQSLSERYSRPRPESANISCRGGGDRMSHRGEERRWRDEQRRAECGREEWRWQGERRDPSTWSVENRVQLHQWQLWLSLERGADGQQHLLSESQRKLCCDAMQDTQVTISEFQRSIAAALAAVRHGFEEEDLELRTGYSLDLALPSSRIAV